MTAIIALSQFGPTGVRPTLATWEKQCAAGRPESVGTRIDRRAGSAREKCPSTSHVLFFFLPARAGTDEAMLVLVTGAHGIASVVGLGVSLVRRARSLITGLIGLVTASLLSGNRPLDAIQGE